MESRRRYLCEGKHCTRDLTWLGLLKKDPKYPCPVAGGYDWSDQSDQTYALDTKSVSCSRNSSCVMIHSISGDWEDSNCDNFTSISAGCKFKIPICDGILGNNISLVCRGHGWCYLDEKCLCFDYGEYFGPYCNGTFCNGISSSNPENTICHGHGECWPLHICNCWGGYYGEDCEETVCDGILSNRTEEVCNGHGACWPRDNCTCEEDEGYYGMRCNEVFSEKPYMNITSSILYIPFQVPVDITMMFRRRRDLGDGDTFPCEDRIRNSDLYEGGGHPESECWWIVVEEDDGSEVTSEIAFRVGYDSLLYNKSSDGGDRDHPIFIQLLTENKIVTLNYTILADIIPPPRPPRDDEDEEEEGGPDVGGIVLGSVGGLAAGILALIISGAICGGLLMTCVACCVMIGSLIVTILCAVGALLVILCSGTTAGTTAVGGAVVGKEVRDEVMDEGPDFVKDAVKERWTQKMEKGSGGGASFEGENDEMDLIGEDDEKETYITDNLQEDILRKDDDVEKNGLELEEEDIDDDEGIINEDYSSEDNEYGIGLCDDNINKEQREKERKKEKKEEEERERVEEKKRLKKENEDQKRKEIELKEENIQSKIERERTDNLSLTLDTKFGRKRNRNRKRELKRIEKILEKEKMKRIRKEEKIELKDLDLKEFEHKQKKKEEEEEEDEGLMIIPKKKVLFEKKKKKKKKKKIETESDDDCVVVVEDDDDSDFEIIE